jgi:hypothetical protein
MCIGNTILYLQAYYFYTRGVESHDRRIAPELLSAKSGKHLTWYWYYQGESDRALAPNLVGPGLAISHPAQVRLSHARFCLSAALRASAFLRPHLVLIFGPSSSASSASFEIAFLSPRNVTS